MKKILFASIPLLLLAITLPLLHTNLTTNAQAPATPTPPLPTVAIWGDPGPSPDFTDVGHFFGNDANSFFQNWGANSTIYSDKIDNSSSMPRHCLYWPDVWKDVKLKVISDNFRYGTNWPLPGEEQIFVYKSAGRDNVSELAFKYLDFLRNKTASEVAALAPSLSANNNNTFQKYNLINPTEYICEDPTDGFCMRWRNETWCPKNKPRAQHKYAQCASYHKDGACKAVLTSLSNTPIETEPGALIKAIFLVTLSLAGGISVILIIAAGYKILTSNGKPEAIQAGRDQLTSALVGLLFIIFSYVIFQFIVADLLKIPGITN